MVHNNSQGKWSSDTTFYFSRFGSMSGATYRAIIVSVRMTEYRQLRTHQKIPKNQISISFTQPKCVSEDSKQLTRFGFPPKSFHLVISSSISSNPYLLISSYLFKYLSLHLALPSSLYLSSSIFI